MDNEVLAYRLGKLDESLDEIKSDMKEIKQMYKEHDAADKKAFYAISDNINEIRNIQNRQKGFISAVLLIASFIGAGVALAVNLKDLL